MISILLNLGASIIAPLLFILWIYFTKTTARAFWYAIVGLCVSYLILISFAGAGWAWFGSFWPYIFAVLFFIVLILSVKTKRFHTWLPKQKREWIDFSVAVAIFLLFASSLPSLLESRSFPQDTAINLQFPLRNGRFQVMHGGGSEVVNYHYVVQAQKFALDIVELNHYGIRASSLLPKDLNAYAIFGNEVVSPCDGTILDSRSDLLDLLPPEGDRKNPAGNFVMIYCQNATVILAHLKHNSVVVKNGDEVYVNDLIGLAGNTGNTSEPHLHIHAIDGKKTSFKDTLRDSKGIPILFDKKFLIRNDIVEKL